MRTYKTLIILIALLAGISVLQISAQASGETDLKTEITTAIDKMNRAIQEKNDPMRNKMYFKFRLVEQDNPGVVAPYLIDNLKNTTPGVSEYTAFVLGWIDDKRAIDPIRKLLTDTNTRKRAACRALGFMRASKALPDMIKLLDDPDNRVRGDAAYGLGLMGDDKANAALKKATQDKDELVRYLAEEALKRIEDYKKFGW